MLTKIIAFFAGPLGTIAGYVAIAAVAIGGYLYWEHSVAQEAAQKAINDFNRKQMEQVIKDKEALAEQLREVSRLQQEAIQEAQRKAQEVDAKLKEVDDFLRSPEAVKQDRPASPLLRETIKKLGDQK